MSESRISKYELGMLLFVGSEATFFIFLIAAYLYFRSAMTATAGPTPVSSLDPTTTGLFSVALLASSGTLWLAHRSLARSREAMVRAWLLATIILGAVFLVGQSMEYTRLLGHGVTMSRNLFGAAFFTLTGFHGLHVLLGLVMLSVLLGHAQWGTVTGPRSAAVEAISLYWHFVDVVWVVIFSVVYLWIRL